MEALSVNGCASAGVPVNTEGPLLAQSGPCSTYVRFVPKLRKEGIKPSRRMAYEILLLR